MQRRAGILMLLGSILFVAGVAMPGVNRFFSAPDEAQQLTVLQENALTWDIGTLLFGLGGLAAAFGLYLWSRDLYARVEGEAWRFACRAGGILSLVGGAVWFVVAIQRMLATAEDIVTDANMIPGGFMFYSMCTGVGILLIALSLIRSGSLKWLGWLTAIVSAVFIGMHIVTGDFVPLNYYLLLTIVGIVLIIAKPTAISADLPPSNASQGSASPA